MEAALDRAREAQTEFCDAIKRSGADRGIVYINGTRDEREVALQRVQSRPVSQKHTITAGQPRSNMIRVHISQVSALPTNGGTHGTHECVRHAGTAQAAAAFSAIWVAMYHLFPAMSSTPPVRSPYGWSMTR